MLWNNFCILLSLVVVKMFFMLFDILVGGMILFVVLFFVWNVFLICCFSVFILDGRYWGFGGGDLLKCYWVCILFKICFGFFFFSCGWLEIFVFIVVKVIVLCLILFLKIVLIRVFLFLFYEFFEVLGIIVFEVDGFGLIEVLFGLVVWFGWFDCLCIMLCSCLEVWIEDLFFFCRW